MHQNLFQFFVSQKAETCGNNIEKELQKPRPKLKKIHQIFTKNICFDFSPLEVVVLCKHVSIL